MNEIINEKTIKIKKCLSELLTELNFFKDSTPEIRNILKKRIAGNYVGYISGLMCGLYNEEQLDIFKTFSNMKIKIFK